MGAGVVTASAGYVAKEDAEKGMKVNYSKIDVNSDLYNTEYDKQYQMARNKILYNDMQEYSVDEPTFEKLVNNEINGAKGDEAPFFVEEKGHDIQRFMKHNKIECNDGDVEGDKINYDDMLIDKSMAFLEKMQIDLVRCGSMFNHTMNKTEAMYQTINSSILFQHFYNYSDDMYFAETNSLGGFESWQSWGYGNLSIVDIGVSCLLEYKVCI